MTAPKADPLDDVRRSDDQKESPAGIRVFAREQNASHPEDHEVPTDILETLSMPDAADIEINFTRPLSYPRPAIFD